MIRGLLDQRKSEFTVRLFTILLAVFLTLALSTGAEAKTLRLGHILPIDSSAHKMLQQYSKLVAERTKGEVKIDVFPAGQLGDWLDQFEMIVKGSLTMGLMPYAFPFDQRLELAYVPGLVSSWEEARQAYGPDGWVTKVMNELLGSVHMKPLGFYFVGMMGLGNTKHEVRLPQDCKDLKLRVVLRSDKALWKKTGAMTVNVPFAELFTAMQTGIVDGQGQNTPVLTYQNFRDVTPHWTQSNHCFETMALVINKEFWAGLSPANKKIMLDTAGEVLAPVNAQAEAEEKVFLQKLRDNGTKVVTLSPEELDQWKKLGRSIWPQLEGYLGKPIMQMCYEAVGMKTK